MEPASHCGQHYKSLPRSIIFTLSNLQRCKRTTSRRVPMTAVTGLPLLDQFIHSGNREATSSKLSLPLVNGTLKMSRRYADISPDQPAPRAADSPHATATSPRRDNEQALPDQQASPHAKNRQSLLRSSSTRTHSQANPDRSPERSGKVRSHASAHVESDRSHVLTESIAPIISITNANPEPFQYPTGKGRCEASIAAASLVRLPAASNPPSTGNGCPRLL